MRFRGPRIRTSRVSGRQVTMTDPEPDEFMSRLREADRAALITRGRRRQWPVGASLFLEGESCKTVMIVESGRVKAFSLTEQGEEILLAVRGPGRCWASSRPSTAA